MNDKQVIKNIIEKSYIEIMIMFLNDNWFRTKMNLNLTTHNVQEKIRNDLKLLHKKFDIHKKSNKSKKSR